MQDSATPGLLVRFRPTGPWRFGPDSGARDRVDLLYHSDTLYSACCSAFRQLGMLEEWLAATAGAGESGSAVRFSSCFPWQGQELFAVPPRTLWPPVPSAKVRWKDARFVPLSLIASILAEKPVEEDRWILDPVSGCLLPATRGPISGPFRVAVRSSAAVDRLEHGWCEPYITACLEFASNAGMWCAVAFAGEEAYSRWSEPVRAAFRLLADSGLGGERSRGWGRSEVPEFSEGALPELLVPSNGPAPATESNQEGAEAPPPAGTAWWMLSLFAPAAADAVDWQRGNYTLLTRGGRVESQAGWGELKKSLRMVAEGSVLVSEKPLRGEAKNVAPDHFPHPVFRAGFAFTIPIPLRTTS